MDYLLKRKKEFKETGDRSYIYKNELDKACFPHGIAYGDFKDLAEIKASDKVLRDKAFNIDKNPKYGGYQRGLTSIIYNFLIKSPQAAVLICMQIMRVLWT